MIYMYCYVVPFLLAYWYSLCFIYQYIYAPFPFTEEFLKPKQVDEKTFLKRPKRPDRASQAPPRPKTAASASVPRPLSSASPRPSSSASCDRPPFVLYGSGDTELQTGSKRTHNVHCSTNVSNFHSCEFWEQDFLHGIMCDC